MKIGIFGQFYHEDSEVYIQHILDVLQKKDVDIVVEKKFLKSINKNKDISKSYSKVSSFKNIDCVRSSSPKEFVLPFALKGILVSI